MDLKKFDLEHWWKMLAAASAALAIASVAVKLIPTVFIGLGMLLIGIGEWMMHPVFTVPMQDGLQRWLVTTSDRRPHVIGVVLDVLGGFLCIAGLVKLLAA
jgi:hypothetical protein